MILEQSARRQQRTCGACGVVCLALLVTVSLIGLVSLPVALESPSNQQHLKEENLLELSIGLEFNKFVEKHRRMYLTEGEKKARYGIFRDNYRRIHAHNLQHKGLVLEINKFGDMDDAEFRKYYLRPVRNKQLLRGEFPMQSNERRHTNIIGDNPDIDWVRDGRVNPPNDQAMCGSCWTFGTTEAAEGLHATLTGKLVKFSEQFMVDCCKVGRSAGCGGGYPQDAFPFLRDTGTVLNALYPYIAQDGVCQAARFNSSDYWHISSFHKITPMNNPDILVSLKKGPMYISIDCPWMFRYYKEGI